MNSCLCACWRPRWATTAGRHQLLRKTQQMPSSTSTKPFCPAWNVWSSSLLLSRRKAVIWPQSCPHSCNRVPCKSAAQEVVRAYMGQHNAGFSRVETLEAVVSALKQQTVLTAETCKSAAQEAVKAYMGQHDAVLPRVDALEAVVSALKQQADLTAETCKSAAHEAVKTHLDQHDAVLPRVDALEAVVALKQQAELTAERYKTCSENPFGSRCLSRGFEQRHAAALLRKRLPQWSWGHLSPYQSLRWLCGHPWSKNILWWTASLRLSSS